MIIYIGYYSPKEYKLLLKYADDRDKLDDKWEDWLIIFIKSKSKLSRNFEVQEFHADVKKMDNYFRKNNLKNTGENRSSYFRVEGEKNYKQKMGN